VLSDGRVSNLTIQNFGLTYGLIEGFIKISKSKSKKKKKKKEIKKVQSALWEILLHLKNHQSWIPRNKETSCYLFLFEYAVQKACQLESDAFNITIWYNYILRINSPCIIFCNTNPSPLLVLLTHVCVCMAWPLYLFSTPFYFHPFCITVSLFILKPSHPKKKFWFYPACLDYRFIFFIFKSDPNFLISLEFSTCW